MKNLVCGLEQFHLSLLVSSYEIRTVTLTPSTRPPLSLTNQNRTGLSTSAAHIQQLS